MASVPRLNPTTNAQIGSRTRKNRHPPNANAAPITTARMAINSVIPTLLLRTMRTPAHDHTHAAKGRTAVCTADARRRRSGGLRLVAPGEVGPAVGEPRVDALDESLVGGDPA